MAQGSSGGASVSTVVCLAPHAPVAAKEGEARAIVRKESAVEELLLWLGISVGDTRSWGCSWGKAGVLVARALV